MIGRCSFSIVALICCINISNVYAQLPDQNTYLIKNLDNYVRYGSLWGHIAPNGREYAILGTQFGTSFVDITDSADIHEVDFVGGINNLFREMKTFSHYAYVVSEAQNSRLQIIDLQYLPDSVSLVSTWNYPGYTTTHTIAQDNNFLYLNGGNASPNGGVVVLDVTNPVLPVKLGQWNTRYVHDCRILNDTIWACNISDQRMTVINAADKNNLQEITNWNNLTGSSPHNCAITDDRKFIFVTNENLNPGRLVIWNIENLNNITYVTEWHPTNIETSIVHNIQIYGNYAIIAHYSAGIRILDITNRANPVEVAWYDTYPSGNTAGIIGCWEVYRFPSGKIIASDIFNGLFVIKTTVPIIGIENTNTIADDYLLYQNFPNPFNPETNIKFTIKQNSQVSLKIYDVKGNEVAHVINDRRDGGEYETKFDADKYNLSSGTYFYTFEVENPKQRFSQTKKMILIK